MKGWADMRIGEMVTLLKSGYTKAEITAMIAEEKAAADIEAPNGNKAPSPHCLSEKSEPSLCLP